MLIANWTLAGVVLMRWNIHQSTKGSAAMWETLFRVGGASGSDLQTAECVWTRKYRPGDKYFITIQTGNLISNIISGAWLLLSCSTFLLKVQSMWKICGFGLPVGAVFGSVFEILLI
jgi:hypothetical protein